MTGNGQTIAFQVPFTHLLKVQFLVILVFRPTHMKQIVRIRRIGVSRHNTRFSFLNFRLVVRQESFHHVLLTMVLDTPRKRIRVALFPYLDAQSFPTHMFIQKGRQGRLMTRRFANDIATPKKHTEKEECLGRIADKVET